ncbi:MAG: hypothetical protein ABFS34_03880 [Gemmatimonadota bacterium]
MGAERQPKDWSSTVALVANLAILVGLVFVIVELRQNQKNLDATVQMSLASAYQEVASRAVENPQFAETIFRMFSTPDSLTEVELVQAINWTSEWAAIVFAASELRATGAISEETWLQHASNFSLFLKDDWFRDFFRAQFAVSYPAEFMAELDSLAAVTQGH